MVLHVIDMVAPRSECFTRMCIFYINVLTRGGVPDVARLWYCSRHDLHVIMNIGCGGKSVQLGYFYCDVSGPQQVTGLIARGLVGFNLETCMQLVVINNAFGYSAM